MEIKKELKYLFGIIFVFILAFFLPVEKAEFTTAVYASLDLLKWYAREHVVLCLLPAFFIAGVISVFVSQASVLKYFGANAKKWVAYTVASVSGAVLAVCSCTILPLFSSVHKRGAGIGPAVAFLYSGPAINILAIILTARILGFEMGIARIIGAISFSIIIGAIMSFIYRKEEKLKKDEQMNIEPPKEKRAMWKTSFHFFTLVLILVFANWAAPSQDATSGTWFFIWSNKWLITSGFSLMLVFSLIFILKMKWQWVISVAIATIVSAFFAFQYIEIGKFAPIIPISVAIIGLVIIGLLDTENQENKEWIMSTWDYAKQIMPLLAIGVLTAGFLLGSTHDGETIAGIIPNQWISQLVGGNSIFSNFFASIVGAFMYFATLTEIPILQGLMNAGMGKGPALSLLLAGPSLSLPNMLVIKGVMGTQKTIVYVILVVVMATLSGIIYGSLF